MSKEDNNIVFCPLCGERLTYKKHKSSHIFVCSLCPFLGFEATDDDSYEDFMDYLKK